MPRFPSPSCRPVATRVLRVLALWLALAALPGEAQDLSPQAAWQALIDRQATLGQQGEFEPSLLAGQQALQLAESTWGPDAAQAATSLHRLAIAHSQLGQPDQALPLLQRALALRERAADPAQASLLASLAIVHSQLGQPDRALALLQRALALREQASGPTHPATATTLTSLAIVLDQLGQPDRALALLQRALAIREQALGPAHPATATTLTSLAIVHDQLGQPDQALALLQRALAIREQALGPAHPATATTLARLAGVEEQLGRAESALARLERALAIREQALGPAHPATGQGWRQFAELLRARQRPQAAIAAYKRAVNIFQAQRQRVAGLGPEDLDSYSRQVAGTYQALAGLLTEQGRLAEAQQVLDMLKEDEQFDFLRRRADVDPRHSRAGYTAAEQAWMQRYEAIAGQLAALGAEAQALARVAPADRTAAQRARQQALDADLGVARQAYRAYLATLREALAAQGPGRAADLAQTSVQAARATQDLVRSLGPGVVLLQYYVTDDAVGMLLTTPGTQLARRSTIRAADLHRQIAQFRRLLGDRTSQPRAAAQALYQVLLAPVAADLEQAGARVVMLSLDGALRYLPFAALHDGRRYAAERWQLPLYTSVARERLREPGTARWQVAGLGVTRALGEFPALPGVRAELGRIVRGAGRGPDGVVPGELYLDEAFTAGRLQEVAQRGFPVLHLASHFRFSPGTEIDSFLLLGDGSRLTLGDLRARNYRFDQVELLTLSACDTGLGGGRDAQGREIEGFGVIAQQQGARAVVATLWPVADGSTALLMAQMYRQRQWHGRGKMDALRQAQLRLLATTAYAHPYYWAPFILMGNWQ